MLEFIFGSVLFMIVFMLGSRMYFKFSKKNVIKLPLNIAVVNAEAFDADEHESNAV